jgi:FixJ family two-component response regulator
MVVPLPLQRQTGMTERNREDPMVVTRSLVSIVDDDESVRDSLPDLLRQLGFAAEAFPSAQAFLDSELVDETRCLILDITMPGMSGPELRRELVSRQQDVPTIFITASGDKTLRPRLLAEGAVECLFKPFSDAALLNALKIALREK